MEHPFTCICSGPTGSGKTRLVRDLIVQRAITPQPTRILWLYAQKQSIHETMNVEFKNGIPEDIESTFKSSENNLLVIDDLMTQCHSDERMTRLFSVGSHHLNLSIIFIVHNLFHQGREMRNMSLNSHYIILFKNPRDNQQIATLARQMKPGKWRHVVEAFEDATSEAHGYLLLDMKPTTPEQIRLRTKILPNTPTIVYMPQ